MNYLESIGKNAKKAFEDLKEVKHKKIKKVLENYNQSLLKNTNQISSSKETIIKDKTNLYSLEKFVYFVDKEELKGDRA